MGKRKERRHAALGGGGRRVKLDLWADPPGTEEYSSQKDETGGAKIENHGAAVPSSPSSSVVAPLVCPQQENPLSLLGQYSDDDEQNEENSSGVADKSEEGITCADKSARVASNCAAEQVKDFLSEMQNEGLFDESSKAGIADEQGRDDLTNELPSDKIQEDAAVNMDICTNSSELQIAQTQDSEVAVDGWRAILDETTGQYYYWNIDSNQTTWELPQANVKNELETLEQSNGTVTECLPDNDRLDSEYPAEPGVPGTEPPNSLVSDASKMADERNVDESFNSRLNETSESQPAGSNDCGPVAKSSVCLETDVKEEDQDVPRLEKDIGNMEDDNLGKDKLKVENATAHSSLIDGELGKAETVKDRESAPADSTSAHAESTSPLDVINWSDRIYQSFKLLEGASGSSSLRSRYTMEAEIRLADCRALLSYGDALLPFWSHTTSQLKRLESVLAVEQAAASAAAEEKSTTSKPFIVFRRRIKNKIKESKSNENKVIPQAIEEQETEPIVSVDQISSLDAEEHADRKPQSLKVENQTFSPSYKHSSTERAENPVLSTERPENPVVCQEKDTDMDVLEEGEIKSEEVVSETSKDTGEVGSHEIEGGLHSEKNSKSIEDGEINDGIADVDMEVDMDVDEQSFPEVSVKNEEINSVHDPSSQPPSVYHDLPSSEKALSSTLELPPQPPDEEWAPPPPPDMDSNPPPPPNEPPPDDEAQIAPINTYEEPSFPVMPYTEHYTSAYMTMPDYGYYATGNDATVSDYYAAAPGTQNDGCDLSYYNHAANAYVDMSCYNNPVEGAVYYNSCSGNVPGSLNVSHPASSIYYGASATTYAASPATMMTSNEASIRGVADGTVSSMPSTSTVDTTSGQVSEAYPSSSMVSNKEDMTSASNATTTNKGQNKAIRSKKRPLSVATTLKSNKKVSSMVDKWKAAKEELHSSDNEDENDATSYLEKKRQREIEEWKNQQIASGEAQDNANFQPLGGDWREKVKRKKLKSAAAAASQDSKSQISEDSSTSKGLEKGTPDLAQLSKGLPAGWQAFWDESSGEVYYGNLSTSETTWARPT